MEKHDKMSNGELLKASLIHHIEHNKPMTCNNSVHCTLSLHKGTSLHDVHQLLDRWMGEVARCVGVGPYALSYAGAWFQYGERKGIRMEWQHLHLAVRTNKSRETGKTISRLSDSEKEGLVEFWKSIGGRSAKIETVFHVPELVRYFIGEKNAMLPGQQMHLVTN